MMKVNVTFQFHDPGYIGLPYWPERNTLINIQKEVHPKLSDAKKQSAILASLEKRGLTMQDYEHLVKAAARPFYTAMTNGKPQPEIIIPERVIQSFINHCSMSAPKAIPRVMSKGLTFIGVKLQDGYLRTGKYEQDGTFDRFVKMEESNQRSFSSTPYIHNFSATGAFLLDEEVIKSEDLQKLLEWGGKWIGVGGARPQGYGRFQITRWEEMATATVGKAKEKVKV